MLDREYEDDKGRKFRVWVTDDEMDLGYGHVVGPPFLDELGLPEETMVRLHNELYRRRLFTSRDVRMRTQDVIGALMSALKVDATKIMELYDG